MEMYKNENMYIIELGKNFLENLAQFFCNGADIVFFTQDQIFGGGGVHQEILNDALSTMKAINH